MTPKAIAYILNLLEKEEEKLRAEFRAYSKTHSDTEADKLYREKIQPAYTYIQQFRAMDWRMK